MLKRAHKMKPISMTSLVDVIFLLLLFFMLTSTFSKFAEVTLSAASEGRATASQSPIFLQLFEDRMTVKGLTQSLNELALKPGEGPNLFVSLHAGVTAQRLTDVLVALRRYPEPSVTVLGAT